MKKNLFSLLKLLVFLFCNWYAFTTAFKLLTYPNDGTFMLGVALIGIACVVDTAIVIGLVKKWIRAAEELAEPKADPDADPSLTTK